MSVAQPMCSTECASSLVAVDHTAGRTRGYDRVQGQDGNARGAGDLRETLADSGVPTRLDQGALRLKTIPLSWSSEGNDGSYLGVSQLQPLKMVQHTPQAPYGTCVRLARPTLH